MADDPNKASGQPGKRGLLFRLSSSTHPERQIPLVDSIVHNLRALLNSDRGISASSPTLGISLHRALSEWDSGRPSVLAEIAELIEDYEPRLSNVEVEAIKDESAKQRFSVMITASLSDDTVFKARTAVQASGATEVEHVIADI